MTATIMYESYAHRRDLLSVMPIRFQMHLRLFGHATNACSSLDSVWNFYLNELNCFENDCTDWAGFP